MSQHDMNVANQAFPATRTDLNNALGALVSLSSGLVAPTTTFAYMLWADTTAGLLKIRNAADTAWITVGTLALAGFGFTKGADIASASPLVLGTDGQMFDVTGTTGFSSITVAANRLFVLQFDGALTLTNSANLILPHATNQTTQAGDRLLGFSEAADTTRVLAYTHATAAAAFTAIKQDASVTATGVVEIATAAEVATGTDATRSITPSTLDGVITGKTDTVITASDEIAFADVTDTNKMKKDTVQGILDLVSAGFTLGTETATTAGTSVTITGLSGKQYIELEFDDVSSSDTSYIEVQIGDAGGLETTGYTGLRVQLSDGVAVVGASIAADTGFRLRTAGNATDLHKGTLTLTLEDSTNNVWMARWSIATDATVLLLVGSGKKALSAGLDRVAIALIGGGTFDAGAINTLSM